MTTTLTPPQKSRLRKLEAQIEADLPRFRKLQEQSRQLARRIGEALATIKAEGLYKPQTWAEYLTSRWDYGKSQAHDLIAAAPIFKDLEGDTSGVPEVGAS